jgi:hypothetical protein
MKGYTLWVTSLFWEALESLIWVEMRYFWQTAVASLWDNPQLKFRKVIFGQDDADLAGHR